MIKALIDATGTLTTLAFFDRGLLGLLVLQGLEDLLDPLDLLVTL